MTPLSLHEIEVLLSGRPVLKGLSLDLHPGEKIAICGPNGAGKSSLIRAAAGLLSPNKGHVELAGRDIRTLAPADRARLRAYLPQERTLTWNMTAGDVVSLGVSHLPGTLVRPRVRNILQQLDIGHLESRGVAAISGGERARVLLARALVSDAPLVLADEPIAGLDPEAQFLVLDLLADRAGRGGTVLASLHDLSLAARWADRVLVLNEGELIVDASPQEALNRDRLSSVFRIDADWNSLPPGDLTIRGRLTQ